MRIRSTTLAAGTLALAALAAGSLPTDASAAERRSAKVVRVIDGDQVVLTSPAGPRSYRLLGVQAPALGDCFGNASRSRLRRLLPGGARVTVVARRRGARSVVVLRRGAGVNRLIVQSGHAEAVGASGDLARRLAAAQDRAERGGRGLWSACAGAVPAPDAGGETSAPSPAPVAGGETSAPSPSPTPTPPPSGDRQQPSQPVTGEEAIRRFTEMLANLRIERFESSFGSGGSGGFSSQTTLDLCANRSFAIERAFTSSVSEPSVERDSGTWSVQAAEVASDGSAGAGIVVLDGSQREELQIAVDSSGRAAIGQAEATASRSPAC